MIIPSPRVKVITWSKSMKLKRRYEVRVVDGGDRDELALGSSGDGVPFARFKEKGDAQAYADRLRSFLGAERMREESGRVVEPATGGEPDEDVSTPSQLPLPLPLPLDTPPDWNGHHEPDDLGAEDDAENPR